MAYTGQLGTVNSKPGNIVPGYNLAAGPPATPISASDACTESLVEVALIKPSLDGTDTGSTSVVELESINISGMISSVTADSGATYITESSQIYVSCSASDLLGSSVLDGAIVLKDIFSADTSATLISEDVSVTVAVQAADSCITSIVESTVIPLSIVSTDTASTSVTELVNTLIVITSSDATGFTLSESIQTVVENTSSDTLIIVGTESTLRDKTILVSDLGTTSVAETQDNKVTLQASELETTVVIEATAITIEISSADIGAWSVTEYAGIALFDSINPVAADSIIVKAIELATVIKNNDYSGPNRRPAIFPPRRAGSESSMNKELRRLLGPRR